MEKKYFPIKTDTSCLAKWSFSKIMLHTGATASCHRVTDHYFDVESFNFHNTPEKIAQRDTMLDGKWPERQPGPGPFSNPDLNGTTCDEYCGKFERNGGRSDRNFYNSLPDLYPLELDQDSTLTSVEPTILEVFIDNTCNLKCVYCMPELSSGIDTEMKKFGRFEKHGIVLETTYKKPNNFDQIQKKFWEWMTNHAHKLKRLHLLGGEPFYQTQFDTFLEFLYNNPCPNLELEIVTNLMIKKSKLEKYMNQIKQLIATKKLGRLDMQCSIDCWGPEQEFTRYGIELKQWEDNFKYLVDQKWIKLNINNTVSVLSIKTLPDLLKKLHEWSKDRKIEHYITELQWPYHMAPGILGADEFANDFDSILELMETDSWRGKEAKEHFTAITNNVKNSRFDKEKVLQLLTYLDEIDNRRGTDWKTLFPWLEEYRNVVQ